MTSITDFDQLVQTMQPQLNHGAYTFCTLQKNQPIPEGTISWFTETEGVSIILPVEIAERLGFPIGFKADWITLQVNSDLSAVGLTAEVSTALAKAGISCNIVAGYHHDHLFVPVGKGQEALQILLELQANQSTTKPLPEP